MPPDDDAVFEVGKICRLSWLRPWSPLALKVGMPPVSGQYEGPKKSLTSAPPCPRSPKLVWSPFL